MVTACRLLEENFAFALELLGFWSVCLACVDTLYALLHRPKPTAMYAPRIVSGVGRNVRSGVFFGLVSLLTATDGCIRAAIAFNSDCFKLGK